MQLSPLLCLLILSIGIIPLTDNAYAEPVYIIEPSEVQIPANVQLGSYRRIIQPFPNWTLVCDENLTSRHKICNIKQDIAIQNAGIIFSWSLVATNTGTPAMLMKLAPTFNTNDSVTVEFSTKDNNYTVNIHQCTPVNCLGVLPVGPIVKKHIDQELDIWISMTSKQLGLIRFKTPMAGIKQALKQL